MNEEIANYVRYIWEQFNQAVPNQVEVDAIVEQLTSGSLTLTQLVSDLYQDANYQNFAAPIARLYEGILDRRADSPGLFFWTGNFRTLGDSAIRTLTSSFLSSPEARALFGGFILDDPTTPEVESVIDDETYVRRLYENVLDRAPDQGGLNFWLGTLQGGFNGDRIALALAFTESPENVDRTADDIQGTLLHVGILGTDLPPYLPTDDDITDYAAANDAGTLDAFIRSLLEEYNATDPAVMAPLDIVQVINGFTIANGEMIGTAADDGPATAPEGTTYISALGGDDTVTGSEGGEAILAGRGNDVVDGAGGSDEITGGFGADLLTGGAGADIFYFTSFRDSTLVAGETTFGIDAITDFDAAEDSIDLSALLLGVGAADTIATVQVASADEETLLADLQGALTDSLTAPLTLVEIASGSAAGLYLVANSGADDDFNSGAGNEDLIIEITGFTGTLDASNFLL